MATTSEPYATQDATSSGGKVHGSFYFFVFNRSNEALRRDVFRVNDF